MNKSLTISMFDIGTMLGDGRFGKVFLVKEKETNFKFGLKMINKSEINQNNLFRQLKREIIIQRNLRHPNILLLLNHFHDHKRIYILLEFAHKGDVSNDISKYGPYSDARAATYLQQLVDSVNYCHSKFVMHRDIKSQNILIGSDGQIKLADFGWAVHRNNSRNLNYVGSIFYRAPEVVLRKFPLGYESDVWSIGVVLYEMLTGTLPFYHENSLTVDRRTVEGDYRIPANINSKAIVLIRRILEVNPQNRLKLDAILNHQYVKDFSENTLQECKASEIMWRSRHCAD